MNFLAKTFNSLTGASFPYTIKEKVVDPTSLTPNLVDQASVWTVYSGTNPKTEYSPITIFEFNLRDPKVASLTSLARNAFKKLKLMRLPGIISVIDFIETDDHLYIITEPVTPLLVYLRENKRVLTTDIKLYGISEVAGSLDFITKKANCLHGNLTIYNSVYVTQLGDWKLFGFEALTNLQSDPDQPVYRLSSQLPTFSETTPESLVSGGVLNSQKLQTNPIRIDAYKLGLFISQVLTEDIDSSAHNRIPNLSRNKFPQELVEVVGKLRDNERYTITNLINRLDTLFNKKNDIIKLNKRLADLQLMNDDEKLEFLTDELEKFLLLDLVLPPGFIEYKLLPELISQYNNLSKRPPTAPTAEPVENNDKSFSIVLNYILKFGKGLSDDAFKKTVKPIILNNFGLSNRAVRMLFLSYLPDFERHLSNYEVELKIFNDLVMGLYDSNFVIREVSLTSISTILDKISLKQINQELLRILAKSQMDPQPTIRVNTLVLIIRISSKIYKSSRNNVLMTALSKSLRDTFTPCKMVALSGFESLIDTFSLEEICTKILGQLAISLMDAKSVKVRKEAKRIFDLYLSAVEKHASSLPQDEEEDEEKEVAEFYENVAKKEEEKEAPASAGTFSMGWGVVNKLLASSEGNGPLNRAFNPSTPDLTQTSTPQNEKIDAFVKEPVTRRNKVNTQQEDNWDQNEEWDVGEDNWDQELSDLDDGWGMDEPTVSKAIPQKIIPKNVLPNLPKTNTINNLPKANVSKVSNLPKVNKLTLGEKPKKSALKLSQKTVSTNLKLDEDQDEGWGDEW